MINYKVGWITGIYLYGQETKGNNGEVVAFDADWGLMVAYKGKMMPQWEYNKRMKNRLDLLSYTEQTTN
jgi:hypothetical protein